MPPQSSAGSGSAPQLYNQLQRYKDLTLIQRLYFGRSRGSFAS